MTISCGAEHSVVSTAAGEVFAWGWGRYGNVGDGQRQDRCPPSHPAIMRLLPAQTVLLQPGTPVCLALAGACAQSRAAQRMVTFRF